MMTCLSVKKKNEVYVTIQSVEPHVHMELADYFSFEVPEAKFLKKNPRYKYWDGTIRLYSPGTGELYGGLMEHLKVWADERQYQIEYEKMIGMEMLKRQMILFLLLVSKLLWIRSPERELLHATISTMRSTKR
jgi:hypothetical protein